VPDITDKLTTSATLTDLAEIFRELQLNLRNFLRKRVSDPNEVEDLLQDIFVKAAAAIQAQRGPSNLVGWLYAAARTTVIDHYRAHQIKYEALHEEMLDETNNNEDLILLQQLATCLRPLVQQLPAIYRDTLLATDFDGKSMKSFAEAQGLSQSAIKSRASRARVMLKEQLLSCCHVEISAGLVHEVQEKSANTCNNCS
jgi:RNA polymerase sigma-70 factor (ECF subfamily)